MAWSGARARFQNWVQFSVAKINDARIAQNPKAEGEWKFSKLWKDLLKFALGLSEVCLWLNSNRFCATSNCRNCVPGKSSNWVRIKSFTKTIDLFASCWRVYIDWLLRPAAMIQLIQTLVFGGRDYSLLEPEWYIDNVNRMLGKKGSINLIKPHVCVCVRYKILNIFFFI